MGRSYRQQDIEMLWGPSAGRCANPECRRVCVKEGTPEDPAAVVGENAHIIAHRDKGPRGDPAMPPDSRDRYENLILLCPTCHTMVDKQRSTYTPEVLRKWKAEHEEWVRDSLRKQMPVITSAELEVVAEAILSAPMPAATDFAVTDPAEKMVRNELGEQTGFLLRMGLGKAKEVAAFVEGVAALDADFPERLKAGFVREYNRATEAGLRGDALFEAMLEFASHESHDFARRAAGLAVLAYLFEKCEVFEK